MTQEQRVSQPHEVVAWVAGTKGRENKLAGFTITVWGLGWQQMSSKRTSRLNDNLIVYYLTKGGGEREREGGGKKAIDIVDIERVHLVKGK